MVESEQEGDFMDNRLRELPTLAADECVSLLGRARIGRVAFAAGDELHVIPVNYLADDGGRVVFRTARDTLLARTVR
jgi:nitroimidazol reductase NimA-like FMN-containing flavoprotein (pyridoxamine 5'-phosphate oxidase superfamily)